jgi:hypothetical protein
LNREKRTWGTFKTLEALGAYDWVWDFFGLSFEAIRRKLKNLRFCFERAWMCFGNIDGVANDDEQKWIVSVGETRLSI